MNSSPSLAPPDPTDCVRSQHLLSRIKRILCPLIAAMAGIGFALPGTAVAAPKQIVVPPSNPYWALLTAQSTKALHYGQQVGTCTFLPSASCGGIQLPAQNLTGAFAPSVTSREPISPAAHWLARSSPTRISAAPICLE